jgi:hypothetical protein
VAVSRPHSPRRPHWICRVCCLPWPCGEARLALVRDYAGATASLRIYLASCLHEATRDLLTLNRYDAPGPEALWNRFLAWAAPRTPGPEKSSGGLSIRPPAVRVGGERPASGRRITEDDTMTMYLLSVVQPSGPGLPEPEVLDKIMADVHAVKNGMREAGVWVFSGGLHPPSTATVVRVRDGEALLTDGPYVEGKEHLGGFTIIEADDLDTALHWGGKLAEATTLPIEVRPFEGIDDGKDEG